MAHEARPTSEEWEHITRILDSLSDAVSAFDRQYRWRYLNPAAREVMRAFGKDPDEIMGRVVFDEIPVVGTEFESALRTALDEARDVHYERYIPEIGRWFETRVVPGRDLITTFARDVTDRHRAEEEIRLGLERGERLLALATALADAGTQDEVADVVLSAGMAAVHADAAALALLVSSPDAASEGPGEFEILRRAGYPDDLSDRFSRFPVVPGRPLSDAVLTRTPVVLESSDEWHARYPAMAAQTTELDYEAMANVPIIADGRVIAGMTFSFRESRTFDDATRTFLSTVGEQCGIALERARAFEAEKTARAAAEEANATKVNFLATMSHELRTPLNAIAGYVELLHRGVYGPVADQQRDVLRRIERNEETLLALINDVLNFARVEAGRLQFDLGVVPAADLIGGIEPLVAPQIAERRIRYETVPCRTEIQARADREKLQQILLNLVANAIKATGENGMIRVGASARGDRVLFFVSDDGVGIPADKLERIFEPFVQLGRGLTSNHSGAGLGLAISRDLARRMHGDITVVSQVGAGSTFTVEMPGV